MSAKANHMMWYITCYANGIAVCVNGLKLNPIVVSPHGGLLVHSQNYLELT